MIYNAMHIMFEEVDFRDIPALFTDLRVDSSTVPLGYHLYEIRYSDDCPHDDVQTAEADYWGAIIISEEYQRALDGYLDVEPDDFTCRTGDDVSLQDFMRVYPSKLSQNGEQFER